MDGVIALIIQYKYLILLPLATIEGPIVSLVAGLMCSLGYLAVAPAFAIIMVGDLIPDVGYYYLGRHARNGGMSNRFGKHFSFFSHHLGFIERLWLEHGRKTMLVSKLAYGLSAPLLMSAGLTNMPLRRYLAYVFPVAVAKCGAIMALGYFLAKSYLHVAQYLRNAGLMFALLAALIIAGYILITLRARRTILAMEQEASSE